MPNYTTIGKDGEVHDYDDVDKDAFFQKSGSSKKSGYSRNQMKREIKVVMDRLGAAEGALIGISSKIAKSPDISNSEVSKIKNMSKDLIKRLQAWKKQAGYIVA